MKITKNKDDEKKSIIFNVLVGDFNAHTHIGDNRQKECHPMIYPRPHNNAMKHLNW